MIKFEKVKAGDILYDVHSYRMGNTTMRSMGVWSVTVFSVDYERRQAVVSWNGNPNQVWYAGMIEKLRAKEPEMESYGLGQKRIKRKTKAAAK